MDNRTQEIFDQITSKDLSELNSNDIKFIKARRTYLSNEQKEKFSSILEVPAKEAKKAKKN